MLWDVSKVCIIQASVQSCSNQKITSVRIARRKTSHLIHLYQTASFATTWIISRMRRATTRAAWDSSDARRIPLTGSLCKLLGCPHQHYNSCLLNLQRRCVNSLRLLQVCLCHCFIILSCRLAPYASTCLPADGLTVLWVKTSAQGSLKLSKHPKNCRN
jgi:hypothetical protein